MFTSIRRHQPGRSGSVLFTARKMSGPDDGAHHAHQGHPHRPVAPHFVEDRVGGTLPALEVQLTLLHVGDERLVDWRERHQSTPLAR